MNVDYDDRFSKYDGKVALPCPPFGDAIVRYHDPIVFRWFRRTHTRIMKHWPDYRPKKQNVNFTARQKKVERGAKSRGTGDE